MKFSAGAEMDFTGLEKQRKHVLKEGTTEIVARQLSGLTANVAVTVELVFEDVFFRAIDDVPFGGFDATRDAFLGDDDFDAKNQRQTMIMHEEAEGAFGSLREVVRELAVDEHLEISDEDLAFRAETDHDFVRDFDLVQFHSRIVN